MTTAPISRRYDLDWLRVVAILTVFLYHSSRFFNLGDWHVKNVHTYTWVEVWSVFAMSWLMPLFFTISGASLFYALGKTTGFAKFYTAKFLRLMVPVLAASVTHSALQVYLERLTHGRFSGSFWAFIAEYFNGVYTGIGDEGNFAFFGMHLWYLLFLFLYSVAGYRLFIWLKGGAKTLLDTTTAFLAVPGLIYLWFSLPLLLLKALVPDEVLRVGAGAWGFFYYPWFLIAGFMIVSSARLQRVIRHQRWISLVLGIAFSAVYLHLKFNAAGAILPDRLGHWPQTTIYFVSSWCWLLAILGLGMQFLRWDHPWRRRANEAVLPFYILHQTVLVLIGYFVMRWAIADGLKWLVVCTTAFITIITLYAALIRRVDLLRFLFGMKTAHPVFHHFRKRSVLLASHLLYIGLIVFAIQTASARRAPMPLTYDPTTDILLDCDAITGHSATGVRVVNDPAAANRRAIDFSAGANQQAEQHPTVYIELQFAAPAGQYTVWLRGKSDGDGWTDSVWLQVDDQINTGRGSFRLGNWRDIQPASEYGWAGDSNHPIGLALTYTGTHTIRIQPRQVPHRIDQIWLSSSQRRIPDTHLPIRRSTY